MVVELKKGYTIESKYDKFTDSYITRLLDNESKQVGRALYSPDIVGRNYDLQSIKDHFVSYINNKTVDETETFEEPEEELTDLDLDLDSEESIEESLDAEIKKKARKTKKATRKAKLPALSKLSPIMPDQAKGISNFNAMQADGNSGMGSTTGSTSLGEEWLDRQTLINKLSDMGFKYNWEKYSDTSLYRIYHERQNYLNKWRKEKKEKDRVKKNNKLLADQKRENAKDSYFRDGIEFESEDAAREYFGESMNEGYKVGRKIARDRLVGHKVSQSSLSQRAQEVLDDNGILEIVDGSQISDLGPKTAKKVSTILNNNGINTEVIERSGGLYTIYLRESMDNKIYLNDMHKAWDIIDPEDEISIPTTHSKLTESLTEARKPKYLNTRFAEKVKQDMKSGKLTYQNIKEWDKEQNDGIEPNPPFNTKELMDYFKDTMNESMNNHEKSIKVVLQKLIRTKYKGFDFAPNLIDDYDIIIKPDVNNTLDITNKEIVLNSELSPDDAAFDIIKLFREKNIINQKGEFTNKHSFKTISEGLKFFEHKHFDETGEDLELETMFEALKSKKKLTGDDIKKLGDFMNRAKSSDEVATYVKGLLSESADTIVDEPFSVSELTDKAEELLSIANNEGVWNTDIYDIDVLGTTAIISILVKGDWKHDHARFDLIAREFFPDAEVYEYELDEDNDYESDYYPSVHVIELNKDNKDESPLKLELMNESIGIDSEATMYRIVSKFEDECRAQGVQVTIDSAEINSEGYFEVAGSIPKNQSMRPDEILDILFDIFAQYGYDDGITYNDWGDNEVKFDVTISERVA